MSRLTKTDDADQVSKWKPITGAGWPIGSGLFLDSSLNPRTFIFDGFSGI
jgi:hypothetical protein